jgi:hypothetical protein
VPFAGHHLKLPILSFNKGPSEGSSRPQDRAFAGRRFVVGEYEARMLFARCDAAKFDVISDLLWHGASPTRYR